MVRAQLTGPDRFVVEQSVLDALTLGSNAMPTSTFEFVSETSRARKPEDGETEVYPLLIGMTA